MAFLGTINPSNRSYVAAGGSGISGSGNSGSVSGSGSRWGPHLASLGIIYDVVTRKYVDGATGLPATGAIPGTTGFAVNGVWQATAPATLSDPAVPPPLAVSRTNLTPEITTPALAAINQNTANSVATQAALPSFVQQANAILNRNYERAQVANDTTGTANALNRSLQDQENAQRALTGEAETQNRNYATDTADRIRRLSDSTNAWEARVNAVADRADAVGQTAAVLPTIGTDTVSANSGATTSRKIAARYAALLGPQKEIAAQRMANLTNVEAPWMQNLYQNDLRLLDAKNTLERQFGGDKRATVQYLQSLATQASQMDQQSAEFYLSQQLRLLGLPEQFMASNISNLGALQRLLGAARVDTAAQPFDPSLIPATPSFPIVTPGRNYMPQGNAQDGTGPNARGWRDWNQSGAVGAPAPLPAIPPGYTSRGNPTWDRQYGYMPQLTGGQTVSWGAPNDGGGYVNGRYLGADAWRNDIPIPAQDVNPDDYAGWG